MSENGLNLIAITRKLSEILAENPGVQVIAIKKGSAKVLLLSNVLLNEWALSRDMEWNENWSAWSVRPFNDVYQQIIIFLPEVEAE